MKHTSDSEDTDKELRDDHAWATEDEQVTAANALDQPESNGGGEHIDKGCNEWDEEGVRDCLKAREEDCQRGNSENLSR